MKVKTITVIGGGTSGLISALMLQKRFPDKEVTIIRSTKLGIVGVGESSTEHWAEFLRFIGLPALSPILEANATLKSGVYFENWAEEDFIHSIQTHFTETEGDYFKIYAHLIANKRPNKELQGHGIWENKVALTHFNDHDNSPFNQFHFDTFKLNEWLSDVCRERRIEIIDDDIHSVEIVDGMIKSVICENGALTSDFFIDATGFKRLLAHKALKSKWVSYADRFPVNSAISFATDESEEYNVYTKSTARDYGWSWTIPTQTRTGNGYVFSDKYINAEQAKHEMEEAYGQELEIREFKFDPGRLEHAWKGNVFAVGLAQSFVEPLEATSIGSVIQSLACFIHHLPSWNDEQCNKDIAAIFDNISDYVQAHYLTTKENTPFWKEVKDNMVLSDTLKENLKKWEHRLPLAGDIKCNWGMFFAANYIPLLYGLKFFDIESIRREYGEYNPDDTIDLKLKHHSDGTFWVSHKKMIKILRDGIHYHLDEN